MLIKCFIAHLATSSPASGRSHYVGKVVYRKLLGKRARLIEIAGTDVKGEEGRTCKKGVTANSLRFALFLVICTIHLLGFVASSGFPSVNVGFAKQLRIHKTMKTNTCPGKPLPTRSCFLISFLSSCRSIF